MPGGAASRSTKSAEQKRCLYLNQSELSRSLGLDLTRPVALTVINLKARFVNKVAWSVRDSMRPNGPNGRKNNEVERS